MDDSENIADRYVEEARWSRTSMYNHKEKAWEIKITDHDNNESRVLYRDDGPPWDKSSMEQWQEAGNK